MPLTTPQKKYSTRELRNLYYQMVKIRIAEEQIAELLNNSEINCPTHLYTGQEAIAVGFCFPLRSTDYVFGNHRSHGHYLAKGGNLKAMMAELFGKETGCSHGRGGSMHIIDKQAGVLGTVPIVAGTIPLAVGTGLSAKLQSQSNVSVAFFGDGAVEEGTFHESMNFASLMKLPTIFVCENNFYSSHLNLLERRAKDNIIESSTLHGMPGHIVDGNNVFDVLEATKTAVRRARRGGGPSFIECRTYRWHGHVGPSWDMDVGVKRKSELEVWRKKDPLLIVKRALLSQGLTETAFDSINQTAEAEVASAIAFAKTEPLPPKEQLLDNVFQV